MIQTVEAFFAFIQTAQVEAQQGFPSTSLDIYIFRPYSPYALICRIF